MIRCMHFDRATSYYFFLISHLIFRNTISRSYSMGLCGNNRFSYAMTIFYFTYKQLPIKGINRETSMECWKEGKKETKIDRHNISQRGRENGG
uniref:Uncharacterized protein n=1 Tax=Nelumbo nucifera TaxID=4432 RepID=A0A822XR92_NELNU|nr:TPA_asm: hypothetical protein HUJ06_024006 [Nelumbo nucifera]